jgi:hypothetical protein
VKTSADRPLTAYLVLAAWTVLGAVGFSIGWLHAVTEDTPCGDEFCVDATFGLFMIAFTVGPLVACVFLFVGGFTTTRFNGTGLVRRLRAGTIGFFAAVAVLALLVVVASL